MSIATQLADAPASVFSGSGSSKASIDVAQGEDVYAAWKAVFEKSRAVVHDGQRPDAHAGQPNSEGSANCHASAAQSELNAGEALHATARRADSNSNVARSGIRAEIATQITSSTDAEPSASLPLNGATLLQRSSGIHKAARQLIASATAPATLPEPTAQPAAAEWVQVFARGSGVAIVVRDTSLSADEAKHCALRTALELTGRSDSLQQLTLNGRTIYQQPARDAQEPAPTARPASGLTFAC